MSDGDPKDDVYGEGWTGREIILPYNPELEAYQAEWNKNNPNNQLTVDGLYGRVMAIHFGRIWNTPIWLENIVAIIGGFIGLVLIIYSIGGIFTLIKVDDKSTKTSSSTYKSSSCNDIAGYYSGNHRSGNAHGTAEMNISNNCRFSWTMNIPGIGRTITKTVYGSLINKGYFYDFVWDDGYNYNTSINGNNIKIYTSQFESDLYKKE
jgi:hypothetical protein